MAGAVTGGSGGSGGGCGTLSADASLAPVNLVFMYDKSGSMGTDPGPAPAWDNYESRWLAVRDGFLAFVENPGSTQLYASLDFFAASTFFSCASAAACNSAPLGPSGRRSVGLLLYFCLMVP